MMVQCWHWRQNGYILTTLRDALDGQIDDTSLFFVREDVRDKMLDEAQVKHERRGAGN